MSLTLCGISFVSFSRQSLHLLVIHFYLISSSLVAMSLRTWHIRLSNRLRVYSPDWLRVFAKLKITLHASHSKFVTFSYEFVEHTSNIQEITFL